MAADQLTLPTMGASRSINYGAYASVPGTGPTGETCQSCKFRVQVHRARVFNKCGLVNWTNGRATDIRVRTPACDRWEAR